MMRSMFNIVLVSITCLFLASCYEGGQPKLNTDEFIIKTQSGEEFTFDLEVADTLDEQMNGLMNRTSLDDDEGMAFPVGIPRIFNMWMRDTQIALDMVFVDEFGEITHIHWEAQPFSDEVITHAIPAKAVLELKGGVALDKDINPGDFVFHPVFKNMHLVDNQELPETRIQRLEREVREFEAYRKKAQEEAEMRAKDTKEDKK